MPHTYLYKTADISEDGLYRYILTRTWDTRPVVAFCGVNPSTADSDKDDNTIRKEVQFAKDWGYGGLVKVNLFGYRATDVRKLLEVADPVGPRNGLAIQEALEAAQTFILAYGSKSGRVGKLVRAQAAKVLAALDHFVDPETDVPARLYCLRKTKDGSPEHTLFLPKTLQPIPYR